MEIADRLVGVEHQLDDAGANDAIEHVGWNGIGLVEVSGDRGPGMLGLNVEDFDRGHCISAKPPQVLSILELKRDPANVIGVSGEKAFDVIAVDWQPAVLCEIGADPCRSAKAAEPHLPYRPPCCHRSAPTPAPLPDESH